MTANLLSPPMVEPVSLADIKAFLKLDSDAEDDLLRAFISSARVHLEHLTGRQFITQTWRVLLDGDLGRRISLPLQPVSNIVSAAILSEDGDLLSLATESFALYQSHNPALIVNSGGMLLTAGQRLQLDLETGYGPSDEDVPMPLKQALKMIVAEWYERRLIADPTQLPTLAKALQPLVNPYKTIRL
ncbi:head-tail connector protein [Cohaesibacter celericrescens]|nr:phage head-tail connector protein [Cohaesibacter celericrescens]